MILLLLKLYTILTELADDWCSKLILSEEFIFCIYWIFVINFWSLDQLWPIFYFACFWFLQGILIEVIVTQCNYFICHWVVWFGFLLLYKLLKFRHKVMDFRCICLRFQIFIYFYYVQNQLLYFFVLYFIKKQFKVLVVGVIFFLLMELFLHRTLDDHVQDF